MQVKLTIGERLKDLRTAQKLTLEQLAAEVGISKSALGKYESDNGKDISPYSILVLADYYGVSCDYLMGRTETKNHPNTALHELHLGDACNGVQREHNKKLNNGLPILHKVPPKRDYGRYFCIMAEKGGTSHGGLTEKLSLFFHAKKQEVNAYGR